MSVCEHHERSVTDPTVAAFLSNIKKLLNKDGGPGLVITHLHHPGFLDFIEIGFFMTVCFCYGAVVDIVWVIVIASFSQ